MNETTHKHVFLKAVPPSVVHLRCIRRRDEGVQMREKLRVSRKTYGNLVSLALQ